MFKQILILTPFYAPNRGGVETFCEELLKELQKKYIVYIATICWGRQKIWKDLPFKECFRIIPELYLKGSCYCANGLDVIYAQGLIAGLVGILLKKRYKVKLYITTHTLYDFKNKSKWFRLMCKQVLNSADIVFTEGRLCRSELENIGVKSQKIRMYQHWIDLNKFYPKKEQNNIKTVLFAGRPIPEKGIHIIKMVEDIMKNQKVRFLYATDIKAEKMPEYYRRADILCVPSLYSESFARVVLEGCATGLAILASNKGSLPELIDPSFGQVFNPTVEAFKRKIEQLINSDEKLTYYQKNARAYAERNFTSKNADIFLNEI